MGESHLLDETAKVRDDATDAARRDAKERSIRYLLPTLSEAELDDLDREILRVLAQREEQAPR